MLYICSVEMYPTHSIECFDQKVTGCKFQTLKSHQLSHRKWTYLVEVRKARVLDNSIPTCAMIRQKELNAVFLLQACLVGGLKGVHSVVNMYHYVKNAKTDLSHLML